MLLQQALVKQHYQVDLAIDGLIGWELAETEPYDLILLDWILPELTGIQFCQRLRTDEQAIPNPNRNTPILLMTALDTVTNKVMGLNAGADDYVVKPFDLDELLARIRALLRRNQAVRTPLLQWGEVHLNPNSCEVSFQAHPIALAPKEYELLELFLRNPEQIFNLNRLLTALWNVEDMPTEGAVRAHIKGLRQKLKQAGADDPLETVYKLGYRLRPQVTIEPAIPPTTETHSSISPAVSPPTGLSIPSELWETWQQVQPSYRDRLAIIQKAVAALQNQTLTLEQQQIAEREAHTLVGSLGSFGLEKASHIARQIQQIFKQPEPLASKEIVKLLPLVATLKQQLEDTADERPQLLIVDALDEAQVLAQEAIAWGWQPQTVRLFEDAQRYLQTGAVQAMLLSLDGATAHKYELQFLTEVRAQYPTLAIATLTAEANLDLRIAAARLGVQWFLKKPIDPTRVFHAIATLLPLSSFPDRILVVGQEPASLQLLYDLMASEGYQVITLTELERFWPTLEDTTPDFLILDLEPDCSCVQASLNAVSPPIVDSADLCRAVRSDPDWHNLPVVVLSQQRDHQTIQRCFTSGADDFLSKPVFPQDLLNRVHSRLEQRKRWGLRKQQ